MNNLLKNSIKKSNLAPDRQCHLASAWSVCDSVRNSAIFNIILINICYDIFQVESALWKEQDMKLANSIFNTNQNQLIAAAFQGLLREFEPGENGKDLNRQVTNPTPGNNI